MGLRAGALLLAGLFAAGSLSDPLAVCAAKKDVVHIGTVEELEDFAKHCHQDNWSKGKTFLLDQDLALPDDMRIVIPSFAGVFQGNGHTISNVTISEAASNSGFFGLVMQDGVVSGLTVKGKYNPDVAMSRIGGIAGSNYGLIDN